MGRSKQHLPKSYWVRKALRQQADPSHIDGPRVAVLAMSLAQQDGVEIKATDKDVANSIRYIRAAVGRRFTVADLERYEAEHFAGGVKINFGQKKRKKRVQRPSSSPARVSVNVVIETLNAARLLIDHCGGVGQGKDLLDVVGGLQR